MSTKRKCKICGEKDDFRNMCIAGTDYIPPTADFNMPSGSHTFICKTCKKNNQNL